jgi:hypothetical protein
MKLFSKIVFLCNLSFLVTVILRYIELNNKKNKGGESIIPLPFVTGILVILGQLAIFLNLIYCLLIIVLWVSKRKKQLPVWLVVFNFILLFIQVYYFLLT